PNGVVGSLLKGVAPHERETVSELDFCGVAVQCEAEQRRNSCRDAATVVEGTLECRQGRREMFPLEFKLAAVIENRRGVRRQGAEQPKALANELPASRAVAVQRRRASRLLDHLERNLCALSPR